MTETRIFCDSCKAEIHSGRTALKVHAGPLRSRFAELDWCPQCLPKLEQLLAVNGHAAAPVESEPQPTARPRGRSRKGPAGETAA